MRSPASLLAVFFLAAACSRGGDGRDTAAADSAAADTAGAAVSSLRSSAIEDPPPPPVDTLGTLRLVGGAVTGAPAGADTTADSIAVAFHYDSTANGLEVTFTAAQRDSVSITEGAYVRAGGTEGATGNGTITARTPRGVIVADLSRGIRSGSALTKCGRQGEQGRGRCGVVVLEVRFTPRNGREVRRNARFDLGN